MAPGGPHLLEAADGSTKATLEDVLVGDVWVCSGQSNMQMGLDEANDGPAAIAQGSKDTTIRLLSIPKAGADQPQPDPGATWRRCDPESLRKFSAVAFFFALHLHQDPGLAKVPLGVIDTSFGGTSIEAWTPPGTLPAIPEGQISGSMFGIAPGHLFNRMIAPLTAAPVKGVVWYQGESNAGHPGAYAGLLENLTKQWRARWHQPELPFLIVQLPAFEGKMGDLDFGWLREAQARACAKSPRTWLAVTYDTTDGSDLHPREKAEIGRRLALLAKHEIFGGDTVCQGPRQTGVEFANGRAIVTFDQPIKAAKGELPTGFSIAGSDGEYRFAKASISSNRAALEAEGVSDPRTVRYAWGGLPNANLTNAAGLPAHPFRADDFAPQSADFQPLPVCQRLETPAYQLETGRFGRVASLVVRGRQFLSNEPDGGAGIPTFFGPRNLSVMRRIGPNRLALSDGSAELEIACQAETMEWTLHNRGGDPFDFRIMLSPQAKITVDGQSTTLTRDNIRLTVQGASPTSTGGQLVTKVPARGTAVIRWNMAAAK